MGIVNLEALKEIFEGYGARILSLPLSEPGPDLTIGCRNYSIELNIKEAKTPPAA